MVVPLRVRGRKRHFPLQMTSEIYGGVLFPQQLPVYEVALPSAPPVCEPSMRFTSTIQGSHTLFQAPVCHLIPSLWDENRIVHDMPLIPHTLGHYICPVSRITLPEARIIGALQLKVKQTKLPHRIKLGKFLKPAVFHFPKFRAQSFRMGAQRNTLPIQRKPIPPHRFSPDNRRLFLDLLAKKAQVPKNAIKLVSVYDRVFLGLYQSLTQGEDGALRCIPKPPLERASQSLPQSPFYLIIGKTLTQPERFIQVVLNMEDYNRLNES